MPPIEAARHNVAARYRDAGKPDTADAILAGTDGHWAVRHEVLRLEREALDAAKTQEQ